MKGTEHFKETIKNYLDQRAKNDELFRAKYETTTRTIEDVVTFILNQVKNSGCNGFSDDEIYGLATHCIDEPSLDIGKPITCSVIVNHHIELTEEERQQQKTLALKRFQDEELRKLEIQRNKVKSKPKTENKQPELSLFDF